MGFVRGEKGKTMRLIDATNAIESIDEIVCSMSVCINSDYCNGMRAMKDMALHAIEKQPTVDAVEVIRCGECAHNCGRVDGYICCDKTKEISIWHSEDWFCADGKRRQKRNGKRSTGRRQSR